VFTMPLRSSTSVVVVDYTRAAWRATAGSPRQDSPRLMTANHPRPRSRIFIRRMCGACSSRAGGHRTCGRAGHQSFPSTTRSSGTGVARCLPALGRGSARGTAGQPPGPGPPGNVPLRTPLPPGARLQTEARVQAGHGAARADMAQDAGQLVAEFLALRHAEELSTARLAIHFSTRPHLSYGVTATSPPSADDPAKPGPSWLTGCRASHPSPPPPHPPHPPMLPPADRRQPHVLAAWSGRHREGRDARRDRATLGLGFDSMAHSLTRVYHTRPRSPGARLVARRRGPTRPGSSAPPGFAFGLLVRAAT